MQIRTNKTIELVLKGVFILLLLKAMTGNPYSYYILLRWAVLGISGYIIYSHFIRAERSWLISFVIIAIIYNPIISIHLTREIWSVINILTIIIIVLSVFIGRRKNDSKALEKTESNDLERF